MVTFKSFKDVILADISRKTVGKIQNVPSITEYQNDLIAIDHDNLKRIEESLSEENICVIAGDMNSGKTWLSYAVGYYFENKSRYHHAYYCQVDEFFSVDDAFQDISEKEGNRKSHWLFIIDDCHQNVQECELLLQKIFARIQDKNLYFLFTTRKVGRYLLRNHEDDDYFYQIYQKKLGGYIELGSKGSMGHVKNIIAKYLMKNRATHIIIDDSDFDIFYSKWENNLFLVMLCLNSWKYSQNQKLSEISESDIHDYLWSGKDGLLLSTYQNQAFFKLLAMICQYGVYIEESMLYTLYDLQQKGNVINGNLIGKYKADGLFVCQEFGGENHLSIPPHYSKIILSTLSHKIATVPENLDRDVVHSFIRLFNLQPVMKLHILALIAKKCLNRRDELYSQANKILGSLLATFGVDEFSGDVYMAPDTMATLITGISRNEIVCEEKKTEIIRKLKTEYVQQNSELIEKRMKQGTARLFEQLLRPLSQLIELNQFLSSFTDNDYVEIINRSSFNSVRTLLYSIHRKWKLKEEKKKIARAISLADIGNLITGLDTDEIYHRANSYCQYLKEIDVEYADMFVSRLIKIRCDRSFTRLITWDTNILDSR